MCSTGGKATTQAARTHTHTRRKRGDGTEPKREQSKKRSSATQDLHNGHANGERHVRICRGVVASRGRTVWAGGAAPKETAHPRLCMAARHPYHGENQHEGKGSTTTCTSKSLSFTNHRKRRGIAYRKKLRKKKAQLDHPLHTPASSLLPSHSKSSTSKSGTSCFTLHMRFSSTHRKAP